MGNGFFSETMGYKAWLDFNSVQRSHQNFIEMLPFTLTFLLIGGLVHPKFSMYAGFNHVIWRVFYLIGYTKMGPNWRLPGAVLANFPIYILGVMDLIALRKYI